MRLPQQLNINDMQNRWSSMIEPTLNRPTNQANILEKIDLKIGTNTISHRLGKRLTGWYTTRVKGPAVIYDNQDMNNTPDLTLILISDSEVTINLAVF